MSEALAEMRKCQAKLEDSEREKTALTYSLQQKEAEITKLQEINRYLPSISLELFDGIKACILLPILELGLFCF